MQYVRCDICLQLALRLANTLKDINQPQVFYRDKITVSLGINQ